MEFEILPIKKRRLAEKKTFKSISLICIFLIVFKILDLLIGGFLHYYTYFNKPDMHELMWNDFYKFEKNSIDVMFFGSSHARFAFDASAFDENLNVKTFNLSSSGQTPVVGYFAVKEALKYQKPKVLVYETYWRLFGTTDNVTPAYFVYDYMKGIDTKGSMLLNIYNEKGFSSLLFQSLLKTYKYRKGITSAFKYISKGDAFRNSISVNSNISYGDFTYYKNGFFGSEKVASDEKLYVTNPFKKAAPDFKLDDEQIEYFKKTIDLCKTNNIKVLLVTAPLPKPTMDFMKDYDKYNNEFSEIAKSFDVNYIDYIMENRKTGMFTNDMFYDSNHLNLKGTKVLDDALIPVINKYLE